MPGCQGLEQTRHASLPYVLVQRTLLQSPGRDTVGREVIASATVCRGPASDNVAVTPTAGARSRG